MRKLLLIVIICILFVIPFFWFKPGEVNLGGDSSRLYFYDPLSYLKSFALYNIAPGEIGIEMISYFFIPFTLFLAVVKSIIPSTYLVITLYHSFILITSFLSIHFILQDFLKTEKAPNRIHVLSGIVGGLFYTFLLHGPNWDKALISHNQLFLNPLMFWLFLRFIHTKNMSYLLISILVSFIFASNFSYASAPPFFAFYPISILFLILYSLFIKKTSIPWKKIFIFITLMISIHAFHIIPEVINVTDGSSNLHSRVFTNVETTQVVDALKGVYLANNLSAIPQAKSIIDFLSFLFLAIIIGGLIILPRTSFNINFKKLIVLISIFFLTVIFLVTANISNIGLQFYALLFKIPGFMMFRYFYGQFLYLFIFFYALTLGLTFFCLVSYVKIKFRNILATFVIVVILLSGWSFIKGDMVNLTVFGSKNIKVPFKMDPKFEKVLTNIKQDPIEGKYLTLPLGLFGYQLLSGTDGGLYIGPSIIGYIGGKKDIPGYSGFANLGDLFLTLVAEKDYKSLELLLSWLNIRYIYHNEDPTIYESFTYYPYAKGYDPNNEFNHGIKRFFPTQSTVADFASNIATKDFNDGLYTIYKTNEYLPHIYTTDTIFEARGFQNDWVFPTELMNINSPISFYENNLNGLFQKETVVRADLQGYDSNFNTINYSVSLPTLGEYEVYLKHPLLKEVDKAFSLEGDKQTLTALEYSQDSQWARLNNFVHNETKDRVPFALSLKNPTNSLTISWQKIENTNGIGMLSASLDTWENPRQYLITFEYATQNKPVIFNLLEKQHTKEGAKTSVTIEESFASTTWTTYQNIVTAAPYSLGAEIQLLSESEQHLTASIRNFTVTPIYKPTIILRKVQSLQNNQTSPRIMFSKINPTKYKITVQDANDPYFLIFSDAFNKHWKLYQSTSSYTHTPIVASYFSGKIQEGNNRNTFFDSNPFETIGKNSIADKTHFIANGYANGWYITPTDTGGKSDYVFILEMTSQRTFYYMIPFTLLAFIICVTWLVIVTLKLKKKH